MRCQFAFAGYLICAAASLVMGQTPPGADARVVVPNNATNKADSNSGTNTGGMRPEDGGIDESARCADIGREFDFPATAVLAVYQGKVVAQGAVGVRRKGGQESITIEDKFHLGSCTKAMTALLAGMLIEKHELRWDSSIGEILGQVIPDLHDEFRNVTMRELLGHRAGLATSPHPLLWTLAWAHQGTPRTQRFDFVKQQLMQTPAYPPGSKFEYSNTGYSVVGVMLEQFTDRTWESLMQEYLFDRLSMKSAGFGPPCLDADVVDQPWGHRPEPVPPGKAADNPDAIGPAGKVHASLPDLGKYLIMALHGLRGESSLATSDTFAEWSRPLEGQAYALGWNVQDRDWAKGRTLSHAGSNTMNYMIIWLAPEIDFAIVAATNTGQKNAAVGLDKLIGQVIGDVLSHE